MSQFLYNVVNVDSSDPLTRRRGLLLNILVVGLNSMLMVFIALSVILIQGGLDPDNTFSDVLHRGHWMLYIHFGIYGLNRKGYVRESSSLYLVLFVVWLSLTSGTNEYTSGLMILLFCIPIVVSNFLVHRFSSFVFSGIISVLYSLYGLNLGYPINLEIIACFFAIALVSWLSVTGFEQAMVDVESNEHKYTELNENMLDGYAAADLTGRMIEWNPAFCDMLGYSDEEMARMNFKDFTPEKWKSISDKYLQEQVLVRGYSDVYEKEYYRKDGSTIPVEIRAYLRYDEEGNPCSFWGVVRDISMRKSAEEDLRVLNEQLEERVEERTAKLEEAQDQLLKQERLATLGKISGGIGHELRNPLAAIKNSVYFLNMVMNENPDPQVQETLDIMNYEITTSEMIISSLLDFASPKPPTRKKVDVNDLVAGAFSRVMIPENVKFLTQFEDDLPVLLGDPIQLGRVFINLGRNAVQAMEKGGKLTVTTQIDNPHGVIISVSDTGCGISPENLKHLFEPLFSTKAKGIGLGLAIIKTFVEAHGGSVSVESEVGVGSMFTLKLPLPKLEGSY
jgi:PAS domain S-box-containing protein